MAEEIPPEQVPLPPADVRQGSILKLPGPTTMQASLGKRNGLGSANQEMSLRVEHSLDGDYVLRTAKKAAKPFRHPIVVVSRPAAEADRVYLYTMTSFSWQSSISEQRFGSDRQRLTEFIPVASVDMSEHPLFKDLGENYVVLSFEHGVSDYESYVRLGQLYSADLKDLTEWATMKDFRMSTRAVQQILSCTAELHSYHPGPQVSEDLL